MLFTYLLSHKSEVWDLTVEHVQLSLTALAIALPFAIVLGMLAALYHRLTLPILTLLGFIYTIPSLALLAFLIPSQGLGRRPALIMLVTYAQLYLVRNITAGLLGVNRDTLEAALGVGMTRIQVLRRVWFPLALPVIIAGVRTAFVTIIGLASIAAWINAGGLGELMFQGISRDYPSMILAGVLSIIALAIVADVILRLLERSTPVSRALRAGTS